VQVAVPLVAIALLLLWAFVIERRR